MNQDVRESRARWALSGELSLPGWLRRLWPVVPVWLVAAAIDLATGQRLSAVWGSIAIVATVVIALPAVRPALAALGAYGAVWVGFNVIRAVADDLPLAVAGTDAVAGWERSLFGGTLPSAWAQARWLDPDRAGVHDIVLALVHGSFFVVPFVVAVVLWWRRRVLFRPYLVATGVAFALGTVGFLLLPTAPPWLAASDEVTRVARLVLGDAFGIEAGASPGEAGYGFEPNALAAMPSVHVAATVLVFLAARRAGRLAGVAGGVYAVLMTVAVVYLGEHYVIDAAGGWLVALAGWWLARRGSHRDQRQPARVRSGREP